MTLYFLHLKKTGGGLLHDEDGSELPDLQAARDEALDAARDLLAATIKAGWDPDTEAIVITDDDGRELDHVSLTAALPNASSCVRPDRITIDCPMEQHPPSSARSPNRLLQILCQADRDLLQPHLEPVNLKRGDVCIEVDTPITHVYFLEGGLGSTVAPDELHGTGEIGMQGYEGLIGVPVLLGADQSPHKVFMQVGGPARRIGVEPLRQAMEQSASLRTLLLHYAHVFLVQTGQTAHVNVNYTLLQRLARWILMSADRLGSSLALTHDYLSFMLGVRRAGVTEALHMLEGEKLIRSTRGNIDVLDRAGLEKMAGQGYGVPEAEYERLIGSWR